MNDFPFHGSVIEAANLEDLWVAEIVFEAEERVRIGQRWVIVVLALENEVDA